MSVLNDQNLTDLATLKDWLDIGQADTAKDNLLQNLINSASSIFMKLMWRKYFILQSIVEQLRGNDSCMLFLEAQPVTTITSIVDTMNIAILPALNAWSAGYRIDPYGVRVFGNVFYKYEIYTVSYSGGYTTTSLEALAAEEAVLSIASLWYKRRGHDDEKSRAQGNQIMTSYVVDDLPAEAKTIADKLKKVA